MNDFKSKLPDFKEIVSIANKFYKDMKKSICEIIDDYKTKHKQETASSSDTPTTETDEEKEDLTKVTKTRKRKTTKKASAESDKSE
jgi:hypothetical protein